MNASGTLEAPGRAGAHPVVRQVGQVALVLAILISTTIALATRYESGVSVGGATRATRVSHIDARWVANKIARDEATAPKPDRPTALDAWWVANKIARDEATAPTPGRP